jgi:hypothetical protein
LSGLLLVTRQSVASSGFSIITVGRDVFLLPGQAAAAAVCCWQG